MAGAPEGNKNSTRERRMLTNALRRELTQNPEDVLAIARKLIEAAKAGEAWAQSLIHDRVDGKVAQPIVGDDDLPAVRVERIERVLVRANPDNRDG